MTTSSGPCFYTVALRSNFDEKGWIVLTTHRAQKPAAARVASIRRAIKEPHVIVGYFTHATKAYPLHGVFHAA